tara:strand:+ start:58 stop:1290 length:1233 start_codon:yes stop_codon:yes gene_type:complete
MGDGYGSPIRLHFEDPEVMAEAGYEDGMELQALSIALSVERKVGGMSLPYLGGRRLGIDMNRSASTIIIDGVFTDDSLVRRGLSAKKASAVIDFGYSMVNARAVPTPSISSDGIRKLANGDGSPSPQHGFLKLKTQDGTTHTISFQRDTGGAVGHISGQSVRIVQIGMTDTVITSAQLATAVASAIATISGTPFTTSISASDATAAGNAKLTITQSTAGKMTAEGSVKFENNANVELYHELFKGGRDASNSGGIKSAGDKVQDLYGILHNTGRGGVGSHVMRSVIGAVSQTLAAVATFGATVIDSFGDDQDPTSPRFGDYPIGLQIPYNSMITAPDGKKYVARNFFVPTGDLGVDDKMSHTNDNPAGVKFSEDDRFTGIKGTVQKFDVAYSAAEEHYTYQMVFVPIDFIG